jgi:hypothetical protein
MATGQYCAMCSQPQQLLPCLLAGLYLIQIASCCSEYHLRIEHLFINVVLLL